MAGDNKPKQIDQQSKPAELGEPTFWTGVAHRQNRWGQRKPLDY